MKQSPRISIIVPCFNHGGFLAETIASVHSANRNDLEIVVVDDGSTDTRTGQEIQKLCDASIKVIRQQNSGLGAARNAGIQASHGEYLFPLDADDRLRTGWIDRGIQMLDSQPHVGVVYGDAQCFGAETHRWITGPFDSERLLNCNFIHCSALFRRAIWDQNGGFATNMPVQGFEDWDFWLGAHERGWQFAYLPQVFFDYRRTAGSMITRAMNFQEEVNEFVAKKHAPLYRQAWLSTLRQRQAMELERLSILGTVRHLEKLLVKRVKQKFTRASKPDSHAS